VAVKGVPAVITISLYTLHKGMNGGAPQRRMPPPRLRTPPMVYITYHDNYYNVALRVIIVTTMIFIFCSPPAVFRRCEEPRFVRGWYRPASRATSGSASPYQQAAARASSATVHSTTGEESIYESADHPPSCRNACNTPDSERYAPHAQTRHRR